MRNGGIVMAGVVASVCLIAGCCEHASKHDAGMHAGMHDGAMNKHASQWENVHSAVAVLVPSKGSTVSGTLTFADVPNGVRVEGEVRGLQPNSEHGFHIHEFGDASATDGMSAGGHYNPEKHEHAGLDATVRHAGDLGNLQANGSGVAKVDLLVPGITVAGLKNPILGRSIVVHEKKDDLKTQPTGDSGARIAVGVIGVSKSATPAMTMPGK